MIQLTPYEQGLRRSTFHLPSARHASAHPSRETHAGHDGTAFPFPRPKSPAEIVDRLELSWRLSRALTPRSPPTPCRWGAGARRWTVASRSIIASTDPGSVGSRDDSRGVASDRFH